MAQDKSLQNLSNYFDSFQDSSADVLLRYASLINELIITYMHSSHEYDIYYKI